MWPLRVATEQVDGSSPAFTGLQYGDLAGPVLWLLGFGLEATADAQKYVFKQDPANRGRFISTGAPSHACRLRHRRAMMRPRHDEAAAP